MSNFPIAICYINGIYPGDYWNLKDVADIQAPPELWWSSRERTAFEDGLPTSEYLELDFGRLRSLNFLNFNILQKPINVTLEYDVWGFESGIKFWQPVTRLTNERFDNHVSYSPNSVNPWKNCQFYFTNVKGDLLSTRYLRLRFDRRDEPWPNGDLANTFPWSIDVKDLRTSRYVVSLNDTRGALVQQGKVVAAIIDPVHYNDLSGDTPQVVADISATESYTVPLGHNGETYFAIMVSNDSCGIYSTAAGTGGMSAVVNGDGQLNGTNNNDGSHHVTSTSITVSEYTDSNEVGHTGTDLPGFGVGWAFFFPQPFATETFAWMIAMGTAPTSGFNTTVLTDYDRRISGSSSSIAISNNFGAPAAGSVMTLCIVVGNNETISSDALLTAAGWTRQITDTSGLAGHGFTLYFYTKIATGSEGSYVYPTVTLSAATKWAATITYLASPSDPTGTCYIIDSGNVSAASVAGSPGNVFTSTHHG